MFVWRFFFITFFFFFNSQSFISKTKKKNYLIKTTIHPPPSTGHHKPNQDPNTHSPVTKPTFHKQKQLIATKFTHQKPTTNTITKNSHNTRSSNHEFPFTMQACCEVDLHCFGQRERDVIVKKEKEKILYYLFVNNTKR